MASALPPATSCLGHVLGAAVGILHRGLVQGKMHLTLMQQHSHTLSSLSFPASEVPPKVLWKGLLSHRNQPNPMQGGWWVPQVSCRIQKESCIPRISVFLGL